MSVKLIAVLLILPFAAAKVDPFGMEDSDVELTDGPIPQTLDAEEEEGKFVLGQQSADEIVRESQKLTAPPVPVANNAVKECKEMAARFKVVPHKTWGTMPFKLQPRWNGLNCAMLVHKQLPEPPLSTLQLQQHQVEHQEPILQYKSKAPATDMQQVPAMAKSTPVPAHDTAYRKKTARDAKKTPMHNLPMPTPTQQQLDAVTSWHRKHEEKQSKDKLAEQKNRFDLREIQFNAAMKWREEKMEQMWNEKHLTQAHEFDKKGKQLNHEYLKQQDMQQENIFLRDKQIDAVHRWHAKTIQDHLESKRNALIGKQHLSAVQAEKRQEAALIQTEKQKEAALKWQQQKAVKQWQEKKEEERATSKQLLHKIKMEQEEKARALTEQSNSRIASKKQVDATLQWHQHKAVQEWQNKQDEHKAYEASLREQTGMWDLAEKQVQADKQEKKALKDLQQSKQLPKFPTEEQIKANIKWHQHKAVQQWQDKRDEQAAHAQLTLNKAMEEQTRQEHAKHATAKKHAKQAMDMQQARSRLPSEEAMLANLKWHQEKAAQHWQEKQDELEAKAMLAQQPKAQELQQHTSEEKHKPANYRQLKAVKKWHKAHSQQVENDAAYVHYFKQRQMNHDITNKDADASSAMPEPEVNNKEEDIDVSSAIPEPEANNKEEDHSGVEADEPVTSDLQQHQQQHHTEESKPHQESEVHRLRKELANMKSKMAKKPKKIAKKEPINEGKGLNPFQGMSIFDDASVMSMMPGGM